jgi:hypothetical protein
MKRTLPFLFFFFGAFFFLFSSRPLEAQGFFSRLSWSAGGSILFFPEDNGMDSDPMPVLPSPGLAVAYPVYGPMWAELTLDLYFTHYGYKDELGRAIPEAIEKRSSQVWAFVLGAQAVARFSPTSLIDLRAYGGFAADMRLVLLAEDLNEGLDDLDGLRGVTNKVRNYFWGQGRWFLPLIGSGIDFNLNERFKLGMDVRMWIPLYKLWTDEGFFKIDGWRFGTGVRLSFK